MKRRDILAGLGGAAVAARTTHAADQSVWLSPQLPEGTREEATLGTLPGKQPLIRLADRPPNYEAPIGTFRAPVTPNDQFFVRYHLAGIPAMDALGTWSLTVGGEARSEEHTSELQSPVHL